MANCMTCRHNDRAAKYCSLKRAHTDLGYVLNCVAWAPTAEAEMRRIRTENAKLRELGEQYETVLADYRSEVAKLRELVRLLLWGVDNDMPRYEELAWTQKVNALVRELGVEVDQ